MTENEKLKKERIAEITKAIMKVAKGEEDRLRDYDPGTNAYIVKPVGFENFSKPLMTTNLSRELVELQGGYHNG